MQSLDSFCFSTQTDRPVSAESPYSPGRRASARARPASAAAPATRPRTEQLWQGLTRPQQSKQLVQTEDGQARIETEDSSKTVRTNSRAGPVHATDYSAEGKLSAGPKQVVVAPPDGSSTQTSCAPGQSQSPQDQAGSKPGSPQPVVIAEGAAEADEAPCSKRPVTAHVQVQSPGVFLRKARPQSAGAANVAHAKAKATQSGVHAFNEPKRETGWVDFRAQNRMGSRVSHPSMFVV